VAGEVLAATLLNDASNESGFGLCEKATERPEALRGEKSSLCADRSP
jgi:hypothetical protein